MNTKIYLYVKTHNITGLKYFGKTIQDPFKYNGSGTRWKNHLVKHGYDISTEIIAEFTNLDECKKFALDFSKDNEIVKSSSWANLKEEDISGGFDHINSLPKDERKNMIAIREKLNSGELKMGGTANWTEESYQKVIKQALINLNNRTVKSGWKLTDEQKNNISRKISGSNNGNFNHIWCVKFDALDCTERKSFHINSIPNGWITIKEWRDNKKDKTKPSYGKNWYNDGVKNYYLYPSDTKIDDLKLEKRRLDINGCCGFSKNSV